MRDERFSKGKDGLGVVRVNPEEVFPFDFETPEGYLARMKKLRADVIQGVENLMKAPGIPHEPEKVTRDVMESKLAKIKEEMDRSITEDAAHYDAMEAGGMKIVPLGDFPSEIAELLKGIQED